MTKGVESAKALSGALLGLHGSPSYTGLTHDAVLATKLLAKSISKLTSIEKLVKGDSAKDSKAGDVTSRMIPIPLCQVLVFSNLNRFKYSDFI